MLKEKNVELDNIKFDNKEKSIKEKAYLILSNIEQKKNFFLTETYDQIRRDIYKNNKDDDHMIENYGYNNYKELKLIMKSNNMVERTIKLGTFIFSIVTFFLFILKFIAPPIILLAFVLSFLFSGLYFSDKNTDIKYSNKLKTNEWIKSISNKKYSDIPISKEYILMIKEVLNHEEFEYVFQKNEDNLKYSNERLIEKLNEKLK